MIDIFEELPKDTTPVFIFPKNPEIIILDGFQVYKYLESYQMEEYIRNFSSKIKLDWFDAIGINQFGADPFAQELIKLQGYKGPVFDIEYHRDHKIEKAIPDRYKDKKVGFIEDILDSGGTTKDILNDCPLGTFLYLTEKIDVHGQFAPPRYRSAVKISDVWVGGFGMNMDSSGDGLPKNFARDKRALYAKII